MSTKIIVNGVAYDSVDAMPPDVRRVYDDMMAKFPNLIGSAGASLPQVTHRKAGPLDVTTSVQKMFVVNGKIYGGDAAMPPDVREQLEQAIRATRASGQTAQKDQVNVSFQVAGPGFTLGKVSDGSERPGARLVASESSSSGAPPAPIEPAAIEWRARFAIVLGVVVVAVALWLLAQVHR